MPVNIQKQNSSGGGDSNSRFIFPAKVKRIILDGSEEGEVTDLTTAEKWGGYDAVGTIFYSKIQKSTQGLTPNIDEISNEENDKWEGDAKPLFSFQKYYPLINEVVLIISTTSKNYLNNRLSTQDYYFPVLNLWNHPHHNTLPAVQNYQEGDKELFKSEEYEKAGLLRRVLDGKLDIDIPLGKYFKEQLGIHPLYLMRGII